MGEPVARPLDCRDIHLPPGVRDVLSRASEGWLKNTEVCDLLVHYRTYGLPICRHPPNRPAGGSVFLFDRRAVRFFRKDGHSWRKKADGKTVRETHEKLKVGNVDMLNCYYAHGDESEDVRLQRRCYWLLEADEDIVLVHYLSAQQMTGGPRSKGPGSRAAISRSTSDEPEASDTTRTTSSDGSGGQRNSLESPFLAKARIANAQSQAAVAAAIASRNAAAGGGGNYVESASPSPQVSVGPSLRPRNRDGTAAQQMPPPQAQSPLSARPKAIAAAATQHLGYSSSLSKSSMLIEGQMPLLPTMSTDSFFNLVESLPAATPRSDAHDTTQGGKGSTMQRQSSGPLRIGSMINAWDEETAIAPHGHIPSLRLNSSALQNNSMLMDPDDLQSVGLPGSSLRLPSSFASPDGYAHFIRGAANATRMHAPGLKTMSGTVPRMQVVTNSDPGTGGMDFENNRTFTVRPTTPLYGGEESPHGTTMSGLNAAEHMQGGWDPATTHGPLSWDSMASGPAHVPVPPPPRAPGLVVHQGGPQPAMPQAPPPSFSPFAQGNMHQQAQQPMPPPPGMQQAQQQALARQQAAMAQQQSVQGMMCRPQSRAMTPAGPQLSDMSASPGMARQLSGALRRQASDAVGPRGTPQPTTWVPDSGTEDVGGSKAARRAGGGAAAVEAELNALQRSMLTTWQGQQLAQAPLGAQVPGWQAQLEGLEARAPASPAGGAHSAFRVTDYSPEWDSTAGGAKLLLTGSLLPGAPMAAQRGPLYLLFDQTEVPATVLQPGVLRATVPPHPPGLVRVAVSLGDGIPRSRPLPFEYRVPPPAQLSVDEQLELQMSDKELQLRLVRMLVDNRSPGSGPESPESPSRSEHGGQQQQQHSTQQGLPSDISPAVLPDEQRTRYLTLLLQREVQRYAAQAQEAVTAGNTANAVDQLSASGLGMLHLFAALGWEWGLTALLLANADVDLRDAHGRTALHWAAARGHEAAVTVLLARKALVSLQTWAAAGRPQCTAADLAAANGHLGLAAFLADALLNELLVRLKPDSRRDALAATAAAVQDSEGGGQRKRTRAERSLYPNAEAEPEEAASEAEALSPTERAERAAAALADAYNKVAQRQAARKLRHEEQRQRDMAAVQRIEQWDHIWQSSEGHTIGATAAAVQHFNMLVARASRLGGSLRAALLAEHSGEDGSRDINDAGSTAAVHSQTDLAKALAHVSAIEDNPEAAAVYERLVEARSAATAGGTAAKVRRGAELETQPSQGLRQLSALSLDGSPPLRPELQPAG